MKNFLLFLSRHGLNDWYFLNYDDRNFYLINNMGYAGVFPKKWFHEISTLQFKGSFNFKINKNNILTFQLNTF